MCRSLIANSFPAVVSAVTRQCYRFAVRADARPLPRRGPVRVATFHPLFHPYRRVRVSPGAPGAGSIDHRQQPVS